MAKSLATAQEGAIWRFGLAQLDERRRELRIDGEVVAIEDASLELLLCLLRAEGELVTQSELREALFADNDPSGSALNAAVRQLRSVLSDQDEQVIRAIGAHGFRLEAAIQLEGLTETAESCLQLESGMQVPKLSGWRLQERLQTRPSNELWRIASGDEFGVLKIALDARAERALRREVTLNRVLIKELGRHSPIVELLEWQFEQRPFWVRMPWYGSGSLSDWVRRAGGVEAIDLERRVRIVAEAAQALAKAHSLGVMHKDIKPGNLLVDEAGDEPRLMLCDFGNGTATSRERLARAGVTVMGFTQTISAETPSGSNSTIALTGTPTYMAPELFKGGVFSERSDVYSLGVMMYQLVAGDLHAPLSLGWEEEVSNAALRKIIARACAGRPERRTAGMHEFCEQLRNWQSGDVTDDDADLPQGHRLSAVVFTDIVDYSAIVHDDEERGKRLLDLQRTVVRQNIRAHGGHEIETNGDGFLIVFDSAVAAVNAVLDIQIAIAQQNRLQGAEDHVQLRASVHLGDVEFRDADVFGDGVNIAARLMPHAPPGGIAVSAEVLESVRQKVKLTAHSIGMPDLKNISRPVEIYLLRAERPAQEAINRLPQRTDARRDADISLCVLPFKNASGDPEQEYFSDGISEDIITDLSKVAALTVVPKSTAFRMRDKANAPEEVAAKLNVKYVLEGTVRQAGDRVRVTAHLIRPADNSQIWSERYNRDWGDIFALQDEIAAAVVSALKLHLLPQEKADIEARGTRNPEAYRYFSMGRALARRAASHDFRASVQLFEKALAIDPEFAEAWAQIGLAHLYNDHSADGHRKVVQAAKRALELDPSQGKAHAIMARILTQSGRLDDAEPCVQKALRLQPDSLTVRSVAGEFYLARREYHAALVQYLEASRLDPLDFRSLAMAGQCQLELGDRAGVRESAREGMQRIEKQLAQDPTDIAALMFGLVMLAQMKDVVRFRQWAEQAVSLDPDNGLLHYNVACGFVNLRLLDEALDRLEIAAPLMTKGRFEWAKVDSDLDPVREHPRFLALMQQAGERLQSHDEDSSNPS